MKRRIRKLSERQRLFCHLYVEVFLMGAPSAREAGYGESGSRVRACRLLKLPRIQDEIKRIQVEFDAKKPKTLEEMHEYWKNYDINKHVQEVRDRLKSDNC